MQDRDIASSLQQEIGAAAASQCSLRIQGGNSKAFYGRQLNARVLDVAGHRGIINHEPTELVITARAGTPLQAIEAQLLSANQVLGFEPPHFGKHTTLGGTIACNLSGPRRLAAGAARDFVLGCKLINGKGEILTFGGQVMKNVAGYDVSRLMCGALGTLGVLLEVSLRVLPRPEMELTLTQEMDVAHALARVHALGRRALPISATVFDGHHLHVRLSGPAAAVRAAQASIGGDPMPSDGDFWLRLREHRLPFFNAGQTLWRISVASNTPALALPGQWLYEWNGGQRWLISDAPGTTIRHAVAAYGGHALRFRERNHSDDVFHPLEAGLMKLHRNLKQAFDPANILNPGKMYPDL